MDRRKAILYLSSLGIVTLSGVVGLNVHRELEKTKRLVATDEKLNNAITTVLPQKEKNVAVKLADENTLDDSIRDTLYKQKHFDNDYKTDIFIEEGSFYTLKRLSRRLNRAKYIVGYANFSVVGYDELIRYAKNYPTIGKFTTDELELMEMLLLRSASDYGFFGDKLIYNLHDKINSKHIKKVAGTGQYLFKGSAIKLLQRIQVDLGEKVILTSGVRGLVKQVQLFTNKAIKTEGNLSKASRSIAPPGHSYHGVGDFDIGELGLGVNNFTEAFSKTDIFKKLTDLDYVDIRYKTDIYTGVRYEPWHIKVISNA